MHLMSTPVFPMFSKPSFVIEISSNENSNLSMIMRRSAKLFQDGNDVSDSLTCQMHVQMMLLMLLMSTSLFPKYSKPSRIITISSNENSNFSMIMTRSVQLFQVGNDVTDSVNMPDAGLDNVIHAFYEHTRI